MSLILLIETATTSCSIALAQNGKILSFKELNERNVHAELITVFIDEVLTQAEKQYHQLDAVAVSCGPGSYTGLRIGVSTAKGLCFALDKPLIAINTLEAMANGIIQKKNSSIADDALLCPMIDARRMEVYTAVFNTAGNTINPTSAQIIDETSFTDLLQQNKMIFFGDGAEKCKAMLANNSNAVFVQNFTNSAVYLAKLAAAKYQAKDFEDTAYFEPYYLKDFVAGKKAI